MCQSGGITPAYAGKRFGGRLLLFQQQDHPRLCGEKYGHMFLFSFRVGSPPPMRGKVIFSPFGSNSDRITPAYAGKRLILLSGTDHLKDHPRLCGEKWIWDKLSRVNWGSPPPMRGKVCEYVIE